MCDTDGFGDSRPHVSKMHASAAMVLSQLWRWCCCARAGATAILKNFVIIAITSWVWTFGNVQLENSTAHSDGLNLFDRKGYFNIGCLKCLGIGPATSFHDEPGMFPTIVKF